MRPQRLLAVLAGSALLTGLLGIAAPAAQGFGYDDLKPWQKRLASGALTDALGDSGAAAKRALSGFKHTSTPDCDGKKGSNVKVNQNCPNITDADLHGRGQSQNETYVAINPSNSSQVVASYNDYRRGDGTCGVSYSGDGGSHWADSTTPNGFTRGATFGAAREYWDGAGDTSVAWDSRGNVYLSCQQFKRGLGVTNNPDASSAFYLYRSTGTGGASFNFAGRPVAELNDVAGTGAALLDKQLMTVDHYTTSPFRDRVYVTWTLFAADGTAYIYGAYSADYGETFSAPVLISSDSVSCGNTFGIATPLGRCNVNQFSQPAVGPDGALYVTWANFNTTAATPADNHQQILLARSTNGGASFSPPVKVGDYFDLPDCPTYQNGADPGRACVVEKGATNNSIFRATNYPYVAVDPKNASHVVVTYGSYINRNSRESNACTPQGFTGPLGNPLYDGVKNGGCNNDIVISESTNAGTSFTGTATDVRALASVTDRPRQRSTDQYWQGLDFSPNGKLVVTYYDRQYGDDNVTGFSDISLSVRSGSSFNADRVTSSSMPPPTQFGGVFYGDYIQVAATQNSAFPVWSDTRTVAGFLCPGTGTPGVPPAVCTAPGATADPSNDQEIFTARVPL
ncbi:exo-alpha-sialidase [Streptosporangiaceae bacterium NEAU-GS5]|nr:exo-alpha-sialidase [Streptosporangiaceae bacterium NEAU-GS5]